MSDNFIQNSFFTKITEGKKIFHAFFTRNGGVSTGIYKSLNLGLGSNDERRNVLANRKIICNYLGIAENNLITLHQIHSNKCIFVEKPFDKRPQADALVTTQPNLALAILTADCCPILFCDEKNNIIAAAHAGWKGALQQITTATIEKMIAHGAQRQNIKALLGPTISQKNYEVGEEFFQNFISQNKTHKKFFTPSKNARHHHFNLPAYILASLANSGIEADMIPRCTYEEPHNFFSYRRASHKNEADYGRQISVIMLQEN